MKLSDLLLIIQNKTLELPVIKAGKKIKGIVIKKNETGVILDCENNCFTGIIMPREVRELGRNGVEIELGAELEAEVMSTDVMHDEGYYIVSITRLLQHDVWKSIIAKSETNEIMTVIPTEANLWGLLIDMHGIKWFIPLSQLAPIHYPRVEDGDQEKIFDKLVSLIGQEFKVRAISIDEENKRVILSEREALKEEREKIMTEMKVWNLYDGQISGLSSYGLFVSLSGGIEWLVHISEISYGHVDSISKFGKVGDPLQVRVIALENNKISLSMKQVKEDPWKVISNTFNEGDVVQGEVIRFVPYGAFIRMFDDINGLIHLTEITDDAIQNPAEKLKLGQIIQAKIILLDIRNRKIWLSVRAMICEEKGIPYEVNKSALNNDRNDRGPRPMKSLDEATVPTIG